MLKGVELVGDFNSWQKEECVADGPTAYSLVKYLAPAVSERSMSFVTVIK